MSAINGDKARFHRQRKQKIHGRSKVRELLKGLAKQAELSSSETGAKTKARLS